jgi:hypothetical protein
VNYEIGLNYKAQDKDSMALIFAEKVLSLGQEYQLEATVLKGSSLDDLGRRAESIEWFKAALKTFGDQPVLYFNLGMDYYRDNKLENARFCAEKALSLNFGHRSSHFLLGLVLSDQGYRSQSVMALSYFLLLEPSTSRSVSAFNVLSEEMKGNVTVDSANNNKIQILVSESHQEDEFSSTDLMISLLNAQRYEAENVGRSELDMLFDNLGKVYRTWGEQKKKKSTGMYWEGYVSILSKIANSPHLDTYLHYIAQASVPASKEWLENNPDKLNAMAEWFKK